ncbi:MAG: NAD(P)-dependent oxidoreductase [Planctomycetota bacterium]
MKVLIADKFEASGIEALRAGGHDVVSQPDLGPDTLPAALAEHRPDVLVVRSTKVPAAVIEAQDSLKGIIRAGAGHDNIDSAAASARGVAVCNCPGMNAVAVAELAMGHLINCDRRLPAQDAELRRGHWHKKEFAKARGLKGRTLGLVGMGAIGREVAARANAFGMDVVGWSRSLTPESASALGIRCGGSSRDELAAMLGECDAVSLHVAATPETKGMCDAGFFAAMKDGAYFVNTARGTLVDEAALVDAIEGKGLRVATDVYQNQPATPDEAFETPMARAATASLSHHCGASTDQAQQAVADETVRIIEAFAASGVFENVVNELQPA